MAGTGAFDGVIVSPLSGRTAKPRAVGQTMVIDKGLGLTQTGDLLEVAAAHIDFIKLGFGTAALYPPEILRAKVALIRSHGVNVYPGGTFLEVAILQEVLEDYLQRAKSIGFNWIEISDGTIRLSPSQRRNAIRRARALGFDVITEVGKKDGGAVLDPDSALEQIRLDLAEGAAKVILEGRESGAGAGIYDSDGGLRTDEMRQIVAGLADPAVLMWEAPQKKQQEELITWFGCNVSLGNIGPGDALALEALRCGLRGDTLKLVLTGAQW